MTPAESCGAVGRQTPADARPVVVIAPDSFKGTFSAREVGAAMAAGARSAGARPVLLPLADGGEGTLDVLAGALGGRRRMVRVTGPLGDPVLAPVLLLDDVDDERIAVVETASAAGLTLVPAQERDPERASTYGVGQLLAAAAGFGARRILLGAGGSATTDGGLGALQAIDDAGGLSAGSAPDATPRSNPDSMLGATPGSTPARIEVLCDVETPFEQAAAVFGPQKGADPATVDRLAARLAELARRYPRNPTGVPRTGAAGGLSGGLWARWDARLVSGIDTVLDVLGMDAALSGARAVLTGEGRLDEQSLEGKAIAGLARRARAAGTPLHAIVGGNLLSDGQLTELGVTSATIATTLREIEDAARRCVAALRLG